MAKCKTHRIEMHEGEARAMCRQKRRKGLRPENVQLSDDWALVTCARCRTHLAPVAVLPASWWQRVKARAWHALFAPWTDDVNPCIDRGGAK